MQRENWKVIASNQVIQLDDADRALLDKVQTRLALGDAEFLHLMIFIGKVAAGPGRLAGVRLPKT